MNTPLGHRTRSHDTAVMRLLGAAALAAGVMGHASDADACGACYANQSESTVVTDHKMAFAIQKQRTILWDQITYAGNPREFAYVIPAKPGTKLEPSNDAWFAALDASTRPILMAPQSRGYGGGGYGYGGDGDYDAWGESGGCCSSMTTSAMSDGRNAGAAGSASMDAGAAGQREKVEVVEQAVVGPYESVTIRSDDPDALQTWLKDHGYAIPDESAPIVAEYVKAGLDFIAMRLQPGQGVRAMQPIRIVSPGTDTSLPLRMMQIGAGAKVGVTLYVIGEGRYRPAPTSFAEATLDFSKLIWDYAQNRSNYQELSKAAMATNEGKTFLTEYADHPSFDPNMGSRPGMTSNPSLAAAYAQACPTYGEPRPDEDAGTSDAGTDARDDAGDPDASGVDPDAGDGDGGDGDGGATSTDAGPPKPPVIVTTTWCDDIDEAVESFALNDIWITRMRADLPKAALATTLRLEPSPTQSKMDNIHYAQSTGTIPASRIARVRASRMHGTLAVVGLTMFVLSRLVRRKKR